MSKPKKIRITQTGSSIRRTRDQLQTLVGLGLGKLHRSREHLATPEIMGMVRKVQHMVQVEEIKA